MPASLPQPTHAGGVVFRTENGQTQFLLVTARRRPDEWVYPKGHIERDEPPDRAAAREVHEESGVSAEIVQRLEDVHIQVAGEDQIIRYFLMKAVGGGPHQEGRRVLWLPESAARQRLSFPESRSTLDRAVDAMKARDLI